MTLDTVLHFFILHNETIILLTIAIICLLSVYVVFRQVFRTPSSLDPVDFSRVEETLKKLLNQTHSAIETVSGPSGTGANSSLSGNGTTDMVAIKKELETRAIMIEELKKEVSSAKTSDTVSAELLAKIKDLEGKLAEYEIIEDDIADLSHYKEENARLKKQLEQMSRGGPALVDQFADAVKTNASPTNTTAEKASAAAEPAKAETAAAPTISVEQAVQTAQAAQVKGAPPVTDDKSKVGETLDFGENKNAESKPVVAPATPIATEAAPATPAMKEAKADIFAEFSGAESEGADPLVALGEIDTNRMLEELKDLNGDLQGSPEALKAPTHLDKVSDEAEKLAGNKKSAAGSAAKSGAS